MLVFASIASCRRVIQEEYELERQSDGIVMAIGRVGQHEKQLDSVQLQKLYLRAESVGLKAEVFDRLRDRL